MTRRPRDDESDHHDAPPADRKNRRGSRRITVPGTGPNSADGPEPRIHAIEHDPKRSKQQKLSERDRWMQEQKPPHY